MRKLWIIFDMHCLCVIMSPCRLPIFVLNSSSLDQDTSAISNIVSVSFSVSLISARNHVQWFLFLLPFSLIVLHLISCFLFRYRTDAMEIAWRTWKYYRRNVSTILTTYYTGNFKQFCSKIAESFKHFYYHFFNVICKWWKQRHRMFILGVALRTVRHSDL